MPSCLWMFGHREVTVQLVILINIYIYCIYHYISLNCCCAAAAAHFSLTMMGFERCSPEGVLHREQTAWDDFKHAACDPDVGLWGICTQGVRYTETQNKVPCNTPAPRRTEPCRWAPTGCTVCFPQTWILQRTQTCSETSDPGQETSMSTRGGNQSCAWEVSSDSSDKPVD